MPAKKKAAKKKAAKKSSGWGGGGGWAGESRGYAATYVMCRKHRRRYPKGGRCPLC